MGHNLDLCKMLGLPKKLKCPRCGEIVEAYFDDYDIECGRPNPSPGKWDLACYCSECEHEWRFTCELLLTITDSFL